MSGFWPWGDIPFRHTDEEMASVTHEELLSYGGLDYTQAQEVVAETLNVFDFDNFYTLLSAMNKFSETYQGNEIRSEIEGLYSYDDRSVATFTACRLETDEEIAERVKQYRVHILNAQSSKRREFERLKRELGE